MRKLTGVIAVLVLAALLFGCGGSSEHSEPPINTAAKRSERPTAANIAAFWSREHANEAPFVEVATLSNGYWINSSAVHFITTARGVRLARAPQTDAYRIRVRYAKRNSSYRWDGEGLVPLTRTIMSIDGKRHQRPLKEIKAYLYNPRIGEAVPLRSRCSGCDNRPRKSDPPRSF